MWILITILALLATLAIFQGWRLNKLEDEQKQFEEFLEDICDTLDALRSRDT